MRIGIDARFLGPEGTGLGRYTEELVKNLQVIDKSNEYIVFLRKENFDLLKLKNKNFKKILADIPWYSLKEQTTLPFLFSSFNLDLLHILHFNAPIFYPGKFIVTIHDLIKSEFTSLSATTKTPFIYFLKHLGYEAVIRTATARAKKVIVPSKTIAHKLNELLKIRSEKIIVTYEASSLSPFAENRERKLADECEAISASEGFRSRRSAGRRYPDRKVAGASSNKQKGEDGKRILEKYKIKKPYLLYVGNAYPYKNLERLLEALKKIPEEVFLVNPCSRSTFYDRLEKKAYETGLTKRVILPGFVPDRELISLYREASAYVFPSLSEGFGIPGLDAFVLGTPVVCSQIPTLKEIYGEAALYFDPESPDDMAEKINDVLEKSGVREGLIEKGLKQVQKYSWQKMAKETLEVYNLALKA